MWAKCQSLALHENEIISVHIYYLIVGNKGNNFQVAVDVIIFWNKWMRAIYTLYSLWQYHRELMQAE